jgi:uncharacterized protein (TIGR02270 family)
MSNVATSRPVVPVVLAQHAEDCIALRETRSVLVRSAHITLEQLGRLDERLRAHLDGLQVAGGPGAQLADEALATPGVGAVFTAAVLALLNHDTERVARLVALARTLPSARRGLVSALGWVPAQSLRQVAAGWFATPDKFLRRLGMAACLVHRVDPGPLLAGAIESPDAGLRAVAAACAGELGRLDLRPACAALLDDADARVRLHAARSAVLLGDRAKALDLCGEIAVAAGPLRGDALPFAVLAADRKRARSLLERLAQQRDEKQPATIRFVLYAVGLAGDLHFIDWLISLMPDPIYARLAGEAFAIITGADLALLDLERKPPEEASPPEDASTPVAFDDDDGMAWPDAARVRTWWQANKAGFTAGARHFVGTTPDAPHCQHVLRESRQRRRWVAALHLALAAPGSVLFNAAAPAWRQRRLLGSR